MYIGTYLLFKKQEAFKNFMIMFVVDSVSFMIYIVNRCVQCWYLYIIFHPYGSIKILTKYT